METFFTEALVSDDLFKLLKQMQNYLFDFKKLEVFALPKLVCLQNEYSMNMFYLSNKWLDNFPSLKTIKKFIEDEKKLFFLPKKDDYYYLYYHLLIAYKKFLQLDKKIYDDETPLDYEYISNYLIRKNLNATKFFEVYLEKGINLNDTDLVHATLEKSDEETNYKFDENIPREMTSEPTAPSLESEIEIEIPKTVSPSPSLEIDIENYPEEKKVEEEE